MHSKLSNTKERINFVASVTIRPQNNLILYEKKSEFKLSSVRNWEDGLLSDVNIDFTLPLLFHILNVSFFPYEKWISFKSVHKYGFILGEAKI